MKVYVKADIGKGSKWYLGTVLGTRLLTRKDLSLFDKQPNWNEHRYLIELRNHQRVTAWQSDTFQRSNDGK